MTFSLHLAVGIFSYVENSLVPINLHRCWPRERIRSPHVPIRDWSKRIEGGGPEQRGGGS